MLSPHLPAPPPPGHHGISSIHVQQQRSRRASETRSSIGPSRSSMGQSMDVAASVRLKKQRPTFADVAHLLHRLLVLATAIGYIFISLDGSKRVLGLLKIKVTPPAFHSSYDSVLLAQAAGTASIRASPLVVTMLGNDTTPRAETLFLDTGASFSTSGCKSGSESEVYRDAFQRSVFAAVTKSLAYNLTFLDPHATELIAPVVDCSLTPLAIQDNTKPRFFFLVRRVADHDDVAVLSVAVGVQEYQDPKHKSSGPAAIATIALINDIRATKTTHHFAASLGYPHAALSFKKFDLVGLDARGCWVLQSVPVDPAGEIPKVIATAAPTGSYISSVDEQSTIGYLIWELQQTPAEVLAHWVWYGKTVIRDVWMWGHLHHLYFAVNAITSLLVLLPIVLDNARAGRIWVGDAFVYASSTHKTRTGLVLLSWCMNHFWTIIKYTLFIGDTLGGKRKFVLFPAIMRAELLSLYITAVGVIGEISKERIDPALTLALFLVGYENRIAIVRRFPAMAKLLIEYTDHEYILGVQPLDPSVPVRSPLRVWNSKPLPMPDAAVVLSALFPVFSTLVFIVAHVACCKLYRWKYPNIVAAHRSSLNSMKEGDGHRSNLTQFEFATGVALRERFGVVSAYDNYVYIKGMRFASADGIYTSAFVIVNGRFLADINDLVAILGIRLTRVRFRSVFVYEVDGNTVKQTARLVYPETIALDDLLHLSLKILL